METKLTLLNVIYGLGGMLIGMVIWQLLETLDSWIGYKHINAKMEEIKLTDAGCKE